MKTKDDSIQIDNIGRCPVGVCHEVHTHTERLIRVEAKVNIVMAGVAAVIVELAIIVIRGMGAV